MAITPQDVGKALEEVYNLELLDEGIFVSLTQGTPKNWLHTNIRPTTEHLNLSNFTLPNGTKLVAMGQFDLTGHIVTPDNDGEPIRVGGFQIGNESPEKFLIIADGVCEQIANILNRRLAEEEVTQKEEKPSLWAKIKNYFGF